jgi:hypothetical protein
MELQLVISLLNAIEYIHETTNYDFDFIATDLLAIDKDLLKAIKKFKDKNLTSN